MTKYKLSVHCLRYIVIALILTASFFTAGYYANSSSDNYNNYESIGLTGAWRSMVQFKSGAFSSVKDLEFMYVFNEGGTMTESSNYDGAPPVPPAYGIWRKTGDMQYEAKYTFYITKPPKSFEELGSGGWMPAGYGVLTEKITLSENGKMFNSILKFDAFDQSGNAVDGGGEAETIAARMEF